MERIIKGNKKSIDILLRKNKRFIEKYGIEIEENKTIEVKENKQIELDKKVVNTINKQDTQQRKRRTKAEIEADKNK